MARGPQGLDQRFGDGREIVGLHGRAPTVCGCGRVNYLTLRVYPKKPGGWGFWEGTALPKPRPEVFGKRLTSGEA